MKVSSSNGFLIILLIAVSVAVGINAAPQSLTCSARKSPCFLKKITCPYECPTTTPSDPKAKVCYINCNSPICKAECRNRKPNCNSPGAACLDPRFIGQQAEVGTILGFKPLVSSLIPTPSLSRLLEQPHGMNEVDHLKFTYNGKEFVILEGHLSSWESQESNLRVERTSNKNSVLVTLPEVAEISVNVVPVTKEDDRIHNYQIPSDNCFAHLEIQFRFSGLSSKVEGVLGRTYRPDFQNPAKPGVAMPVAGGEDKYRTSSLLSSNCNSCLFNPAGAFDQKDALLMDYSTLDCTGSATSGNGIVCRK
ncbi:hypothetical protein Patl1_04563 [Pistacia atlantica]|uniref:Uncharacterized protein n=1 Tax=Pistacia atlantica TaxID=434234 RepID=A0ACC1BWB5_9ROSI|nr:hypothetical protein Patl1_04563 [Pistacia atlantica]